MFDGWVGREGSCDERVSRIEISMVFERALLFFSFSVSVSVSIFCCVTDGCRM